MSDDPADSMPIVSSLAEGQALGCTFGIYGEEGAFGYDEDVFRVFSVCDDGTLTMTHHSDHWGVEAWSPPEVSDAVS